MSNQLDNIPNISQLDGTVRHLLTYKPKGIRNFMVRFEHMFFFYRSFHMLLVLLLEDQLYIIKSHLVNYKFQELVTTYPKSWYTFMDSLGECI